MQFDQNQVNQSKEERLHAQKRNNKDAILLLLIILGLIMIVLQASGLIQIFTLKSKWSIIGLIAVGLGLAVATINSYLQNSRLKRMIQRLTEQQKKRRVNVTLPAKSGGDEIDENVQDADPEWTEKVKFSAVIEERQRLARELHDAVSQQLFAISMTATAVSRTIEKDWERARRQVQLIEEMAAVAQSEMRALLLHLRPVHLDGKSLGQALASLVEELQQKIPMDIQLEVDESIALMPQSEDHLFRIAQEALSNTLRHSKADRMYIKLLTYDNKVHMTLQDNGVGFDVELKKQTSYGLLTMDERVSELGGSLQVMSEPGSGTTIHLWVPVTGMKQTD